MPATWAWRVLVKSTGLAVEDDLALVALVDPGQDLHEGGFARAVLAHQGVDLAGVDVEVDVGEREDAGEAHGDAAHLEDARDASRGRARDG